MNKEQKLKLNTKMYRIAKIDENYYINGKLVTDDLQYKIKVRLALADFKKDIEENKIKIRSRIYTI